MKVAKPDFFYGERNKFNGWVNQILLYFRMEGIGESKQPLIAASFLRGEAEQGIRPRVTAKLLRNEDPDGWFTSLENFVNALNAIYGLSNDKQVAIRTIQNLTQKASTSQYTAKFKEAQSKTGWDDSALCTMYYRGLKDQIKDELVRAKVEHALGLLNLIKQAIDIDDCLYERSIEKQHSGQNRG